MTEPTNPTDPAIDAAKQALYAYTASTLVTEASAPLFAEIIRCRYAPILAAKDARIATLENARPDQWLPKSIAVSDIASEALELRAKLIQANIRCAQLEEYRAEITRLKGVCMELAWHEGDIDRPPTPSSLSAQGGAADSRRLDWLEKNGHVAAKYRQMPPASDHTSGPYWKINWTHGNEHTVTLRAAIDDAMNFIPPTPPNAAPEGST